jgi:transcriptional regulator with XRE-family HTH domain
VEVYEKINYLISEKNMTKKEFVDKLINLEPKLRLSGETPSVQTVYRYLSGKRELKIELIPYIAEVLDVSEQELFSFDIEYASEYDIRYSKEAREILKLLPYAPKNMVEHITTTLQKFKVNYDEGTKNIC